MSARCNICDVEWPDHAEACAYVHTARRVNDLEASLRRVSGLLQKRRPWNDNVWAAQQIANAAANSQAESR